MTDDSRRGVEDRAGPPPGVALVVRLDGALVVCVGAGPVAASKVLPLLDAGADLVVVAPGAAPALARAAEAGRLAWHRRGWRESDLDGAWLVVAATADGERNAAVVAAASARATPCVRVDRSGAGTAEMPAVVRRGPLTIAVSTDGQAPALSRHLRRRLEAAYGPEWGQLASVYGEVRRDPAVVAALAGLPDDERRRRWRGVPVADTLRLIRNGCLSDAKRAVSTWVSSSSD